MTSLFDSDGELHCDGVLFFILSNKSSKQFISLKVNAELKFDDEFKNVKTCY